MWNYDAPIQIVEDWSREHGEFHDTWGQSMPPDEDGEIRRPKALLDWGRPVPDPVDEQDWGAAKTSPPTTTPRAVQLMSF